VAVVTPDRGRRLFFWLIAAQALHSVEEYAFRLYDVLAPARWVSRTIGGSDPALGFAAANAAVVLLGVWCAVARVRPAHPSATAWMWFWTALEGANGVGHLLFAAGARGYFPGAFTAPLLLALAVALARDLARPPDRADPAPAS
jgi:hypothetical protein